MSNADEHDLSNDVLLELNTMRFSVYFKMRFVLTDQYITAVLLRIGFMQADTSKLLQFLFLCTFIIVFAASLLQDYFKAEDMGLPKDEDFLSINLKICATVGFLTNTGFILSWTRSGGTKFRLSRAVEWLETFIIGTLAYLQQQDIHIAAFLSEMRKHNTES